MRKKNKAKFAGLISILVAFAIGFVIYIVISALGADIASDLKDDQDPGSHSYNITTELLEGQTKLAGKTDTIVTVVVAGIILLAVMGFAGYKSMQGGA